MKGFKHTIANNIRRLRFEKDEMTQAELARKINVTRQTIIALEANKYVPSLVLALKMAYIFNVRVEDIFTLKGWEQEIQDTPEIKS